jgi:hypothetical protein
MDKMSRKDGLVAEGAPAAGPDSSDGTRLRDGCGKDAIFGNYGLDASACRGKVAEWGNRFTRRHNGSVRSRIQRVLTKQPSSASEWRVYVESENPHLLSRLLGQPLFEDQHGVERAIKRPSDTLTSFSDKPGTGLPLSVRVPLIRPQLLLELWLN